LNRTLSLAAVAAVAGLIVLAILFPRFDPSVRATLSYDRTQAIKRAREVTKRYGVDTSKWQATITETTNDRYVPFRKLYPSDPVAPLFGALTVDVTLREPNSRQNAHVDLFPDGRVSRVRFRGNTTAGPTPETILNDFAGATLSPSFTTTKAKDEAGVIDHSWEWKPGSEPPLHATLDVQLKSGALVSAKLTPVYDVVFNRRVRRSVSLEISRSLVILVWMLALAIAVWQASRHRIHWRVPLILVGVQIAWAAVSYFGSIDYQAFAGREDSAIDSLVETFTENFAVVSSFFWLFVFAAAGFALRSALNREKWHSVELISRGVLVNRVIGQSVAIGLLSGIGLACLPYIAAAFPFRNNFLEFRSTDALMSVSPSLSAVRLSEAVPVLALFGFFLPFVRGLRRVWIAWAIFLPVGMFVLMDYLPFHDNGGAIVTAALTLAGYLWIYLRSDLVAVLAASVAARAVIVPCVLWSQPLGYFRESSLSLLTLGAVILTGSVYWALRGPESEQTDLVPGIRPDLEPTERSDRERLQAEFEVARKAQQNALPADPPSVNGYTLAGWCEPAQQVGGDLYEFFPLPDGRTGVAVADVSGKGVPAALYMMVTKGLVAATSRESNQLSYILGQVNLHLYRACRKKVFVTLAAVILDPTNLRLEYGRAGHNPVVWRRTRRGETTLLKSPGLGLGMTPGERFTRTLKIEELELEPDDAIVLYSDGVTEAINQDMEQFGEARLMRAVEAADGQPARAARDSILRELADFMGATPARDDITLVVIRA